MWKFQEGEFEEKLEVGLGGGWARVLGVERDHLFAVRIGARIAPRNGCQFAPVKHRQIHRLKRPVPGRVL